MDQRLENGTRLDTFKIVRLIGKGGMGEVYEAYEEVLNRKVALKIITTDEDDKAAQSFVSEGQALAKINHPNVVTIYRFGKAQGIDYIAMEYVEGRSLKTLISNKELDLSMILHIFDRVVSGVKSLHKQQIIHRDLKPKNILIAKDKSVKIVDFGISQNFRESEQFKKTGKIVGSVFYIPPEVIRGKPATLKSDIWNLGVVLYEMLLGEKPYSGKTSEEILKSVRDNDIKIPMHKKISLDVELMNLILWMSQRDPENRPDNIRQVQEALRNYVANANVAPIDLSGPHTDPLMQQTARLSPPPTKTQTMHKSVTEKTFALDLGEILLRKPKFSMVLSFILIFSGIAWWMTRETLPEIVEPLDDVAESAPESIPEKIIESEIDDPPEAPQVSKKEEIRKKQIARVPVQKKKLLRKAKTKTKIKRARLRLKKPRISSLKTNVVLQFDSSRRKRNVSSVASKITNPPIIRWEPVSGAKKYRIEISKDKNFSSFVQSTHSRGTSYSYMPKSPGTYYWRVQAVGVSGRVGHFSELGMLNIKIPAPVLKRSRYIVPLSVAQGGAKITWEDVPMAGYYELTLSQDVNFRKIWRKTILKNSEYVFKHAAPTSYYIRLRSLGIDRKPASVASRSVKMEVLVPKVLNQPQAKKPDNGTVMPKAYIEQKKLRFFWNSVPEATHYQLQFSADNSFKTLLYDKKYKKNGVIFIETLPSGNVFWRVRAKGQGGSVSPWTKPKLLIIK